MAYPYMGPPPMSGVALDSENHILRYEITHAGPCMGLVCENHTHLKPISSKGAIIKREVAELVCYFTSNYWKI